LFEPYHSCSVHHKQLTLACIITRHLVSLHPLVLFLPEIARLFSHEVAAQIQHAGLGVPSWQEDIEEKIPRIARIVVIQSRG
jgi:hypothetical protein